MRALRVVFCYLCLKITFTISTAKIAQCSITGFTLSLVSSRNRTGYWTSQVHLEHADDKSSLPWHVKMDHNSAQCNGNENVKITATVSGDCRTGEFEVWVSSYCTDTVRPGSGYELLPGLGYYKMHTTAEKWDDARKICIQEGTHLLILNSGAEMDAVRSLWAKSPNVSGSIFPEYIYVGIHDRFNEGDYITILDQPLRDTGYVVWDYNEPNNAGGDEDCIGVKRTGGLNDIGCDLKMAFMCELEL